MHVADGAITHHSQANFESVIASHDPWKPCQYPLLLPAAGPITQDYGIPLEAVQREGICGWQRVLGLVTGPSPARAPLETPDWVSEAFAPGFTCLLPYLGVKLILRSGMRAVDVSPDDSPRSRHQAVEDWVFNASTDGSDTGTATRRTSISSTIYTSSVTTVGDECLAYS